MSLADEVQGIADVIKAKFPDALIHYYQEPIPAERENGQFVIILKQDIRRSESLSQTWTQRQYSVIGYGEDVQQAVSRMEDLSRFMMNEQGSALTPAAGRALKIESFSFDGAEQMEGGLQKCTAVLQLQYREPVATEEFTKMSHIGVRTEYNSKGGH
ncbi:hypothetical protein EJP77_10590 [Paenibacillus zeisoli]|uniref:DUF3168 domain-containing protein n=1 Tax=Paenibacillus zeisoli TaxID=2496267 RepID=A0A3S1D9E1_9BACL|nr:hypothetical protein [Paenibacillus zeisoli]RUT31823.1 hypothetical protein EJP77_10590 [Paenibacillus zeisoli]